MRKWLILILCLAPLPALGVSTSHWTHNSEADFKAGTLHNVVVSNLGDLKLSRAVKTILEQDARVNSVNAMAEAADGTLYAATSPKGVLLAVKADKITTAATIDDAVSVLSLLVDDKGGLILGTGGDKGRVLRIDKPGDKPREIFSADGVQYIWALAQTPYGQIYAATGPAGQLFQISPDGSHSELYKGSENNITALVSDGRDLLYMGTDPDGLVIRLNRKTKESFVMYNASETEITALALDGAGNLYAATGEEPDQQQQALPDQGAKDQTGRPESDTGSMPLPSNPPPAPKPPELPNPNPGEPPPIPKHSSDDEPKKLMLFADPGSAGNDDPDNPTPPPNGPPDAPGNPGARQPPGPQQGQPPHGGASAPSAESQTPKPEGNAIYKIDPDGFVTEIYRQPVIVYSMIMQNGVLLVGTGPDGNIYQVDPATQETEALAKVDPKQVMCLLAAKDGRVMLGLANAGGISAMSGGFASDGEYTSAVLDATQVSRFGKIHLDGTLPEKTTLKISTRSGNVRDASVAGWSNWTEPVGAQEFLPVESPSARFLQYRLIFASSDGVGTPVVNYVDTAYQIPNMAPVVKAIRVGADAVNAANGATPPPSGPQPPNGAAKPAGTGVVPIAWDASDPNNDNLVFSLYFRRGTAGPWILLKDKLKDTNFDWDTHNVPDGRYQIKVVASDSPSNPPGEEKAASRVSEITTVDNTPPLIGDLKPNVAGGQAKIDFTVWDQTSTVAAVEYAVDSADDWQVALPVDRIFDSQKEIIHLTIADLTPGEHVVTIRATDSHGNQAFENVTLKIEAAAGK
jgi:hypothetical protein